MHTIHSISFHRTEPFYRPSKRFPSKPDGTHSCTINGAPVRGLTLTQPWGWLMQEGHKIDENRPKKWTCIIHTFFLIHAAERMREGDYKNCQSFMESREIANVLLPKPEDIKVGGFIAVAYCEFAGTADTYRYHNIKPDRFFTGPRAYRLKVRPIPFIPAQGNRGLFTPVLREDQWAEIVKIIQA